MSSKSKHAVFLVGLILGLAPLHLHANVWLHIKNETHQKATFKVVGTWNCAEKPLVPGHVFGNAMPGKEIVAWVDRAGGDCSGKGGEIEMQIEFQGTPASETQKLQFDNRAWITQINRPHEEYSSSLRYTHTDDGGKQHWTLKISPPVPVVEGMVTPSNNVAMDSGQWAFENQRQVQLRISNPARTNVTDSGRPAQRESGNGAEGTLGTYYSEEGVGAIQFPMWHAQHVVRLPNKNGRAYFAVTQSRAHAGYLQVMRTDPGMLDDNDLVKSKGETGKVGEFIWMDYFDPYNPIGNWNHPCKMGLIGDVLVVVAQNWQKYYPGTSDHSLLFYNMIDPENPVFWGKITQKELGLGGELDSLGFYEYQGSYFLTTKDTTWRAPQVSPRIEDWKKVTTDSYEGQHGMFFNSLQEGVGNERTASEVTKGQERPMWFDIKNHDLRFHELVPQNGGLLKLHEDADFQRSPGLQGAERSFATCSLYVTSKKEPVIYWMRLDKINTNGRQMGDGIIYQAANTANTPPAPQISSGSN